MGRFTRSSNVSPCGVILTFKSRDEKRQKRLKKDQLRSTTINAQQLVLWMEIGDRMVKEAAKIKSPLLVLHGGDDKICDAKASQALVDACTVTDKKYELLPPYRHDLYNEKDRETVFLKVLEWINQRLVKQDPPSDEKMTPKPEEPKPVEETKPEPVEEPKAEPVVVVAPVKEEPTPVEEKPVKEEPTPAEEPKEVKPEVDNHPESPPYNAHMQPLPVEETKPEPVEEQKPVVVTPVEEPVKEEPKQESKPEPATNGIYKVPLKLHKHVIGGGGKVIKEISSKNDVKIDLNGDENKMTITNKDNDENKVAAAFQDVRNALEEVGWFYENGEWTEKLAYDAIFREWSVKIDEEGTLMKKCFDDAKIAFDAGNKEEAKNLSTKGKEHQEKMHQYKKDCATAVFDFLNAKHDDYTMDLHGQLVNEAMEFVVQRIEKLTGKADKPLQIITGAGNHSDEKGAKIKPAVFKYLGEKGLKYEEVNNGTISVTL